MKQSILLSAIYLTLTLSLGTLRADEGCIPIAGPTTSAAPGHHVLTRDIDVSGATGIVIDAHHVTLDLNGQVISSALSTNVLIGISQTADFVNIRNGRLSGGNDGIKAGSTVSQAVNPSRRRREVRK